MLDVRDGLTCGKRIGKKFLPKTSNGERTITRGSFGRMPA